MRSAPAVLNTIRNHFRIVSTLAIALLLAFGNPGIDSLLVNANPVWCLNCAAPTFEPIQVYPATSGRGSLALGDFNNDGKIDLLAGGELGQSAVLLSNGRGAFGSPLANEVEGVSSLSGVSFENRVQVADFNHDGSLDLVVVADSDHPRVALLYGDGTGHFGTPVLYDPVDPNGGSVYSVVVADFNKDNNPDVAAFGFMMLWPARIFWGDGEGLNPVSYGTNRESSYATPGTSITVADFNADYHLDILTWVPTEPLGVLEFGNGAGGFTSINCTTLDQSGDGGSYAVGDFNGDGNVDIATNTGAVQLGDGTGVFSTAVWYPVGSAAGVARAADINGDGKYDLVFRGGILLGDGMGNFGALLPFDVGTLISDLEISDFNDDGKADIATANLDGSVSVFINNTYQTPLGPNSTVVVANTTLTFDQVTGGGTTTVTPIDPASVGQVPGGFAVSNSVAYEIATTATFNGSVTLSFKVPGPISEEDFNNLAILHNENGNLVDVTASTPSRDYVNLTIYARTTSFSPFYLARRGPHIKTLFDQSRAYKSGSTIPIKLQIMNSANANVSSASASLVTRDLRLMSGNTTAPVVDSGNANPDYAFRYDVTLGGNGGGYIFNLSTKGLAPGQYVLSFYVGSERSFFYTVKFEVK